MPTKNKTWFDVKALAKAEAEVLIYDAIGAYGVTAKDLVKQVKAIDAKRIVVRINSPGGDVFDGTAIHNAFKAHPAEIIVHIDGVAASAASFIAMAGDEITIAKSAYMMVHEAWGLCQGPSEDMRKVAAMLDKCNESIAQMYADRSGKPAEEWRDVMAAETWYLGQEAVDAGLCDAVEQTEAEPATARAAFNYAIFNKIPDPLRRAWGVPTNAQDPKGLKPVAYKKGDRIRVKGEPHMPGQMEGEVVVVRQNVTANAILFDGDDEPHEWYLDDEIEALADENSEMPEMRASSGVRPASIPNRKGGSMTIESFNAYAAEHPDAVEQYVNKGREQAAAELAPKPASIDEMRAAFNDSNFIIDMLGKTATLDQAKAAYADVLKDKLAKAEADKAELQKRLDLAGKAAAPLNLGGAAGTTEAADPASIEDPKARAAAEWDAKLPDCANFSTKDSYVNYRTAVLTGTLRTK